MSEDRTEHALQASLLSWLTVSGVCLPQFRLLKSFIARSDRFLALLTGLSSSFSSSLLLFSSSCLLLQRLSMSVCILYTLYLHNTITPASKSFFFIEKSMPKGPLERNFEQHTGAVEVR